MTQPTTMPSLVIKTTYRIGAGDVDAFWELATRMASEATRRAGNSFLNAAQDVLDPATFHLMEGWASQTAFDAHIASPEFQAVLGEALRLRIDERFGAKFDICGMQDLELPV